MLGSRFFFSTFFVIHTFVKVHTYTERCVHIFSNYSESKSYELLTVYSWYLLTRIIVVKPSIDFYLPGCICWFFVSMLSHLDFLCMRYIFRRKAYYSNQFKKFEYSSRDYTHTHTKHISLRSFFSSLDQQFSAYICFFIEYNRPGRAEPNTTKENAIMVMTK